MRKGVGSLALGVIACAGWIGCNAILGNESAVFDPGAASSGSSGGSSGGDANATDGASSGLLDGQIPDGADPDSGPCVNLPINPKHCGSCFHDCLGGGCAEGRCLPFTLAAEMGKPTAITLDDTHVYWTNIASGDVMRVAKTGGTPERVFDGADNTDPGKEIGVADGNVYFAHTVGDAGLARCPVTGCSPNTTAIPVVENGAEIDAVVVEDNAILFVEFAFAGRALRCQLPCTNGLFEVIASDESFPLRSAAANAGAVQAWSTLGSGGALRVRNGGGSSFTLANGTAYAVAISGEEVFFMNPAKGPQAILRDGGGGGVRTLATIGGLFATEMVLDGNDVYFTNTSETGDIYRCPKSGCDDAGVAIATKQSRPVGIAVDAKSIYWANQGGSIQRMAK